MELIDRFGNTIREPQKKTGAKIMIDIQHLQKHGIDLITVALKGRLTAEEYNIFRAHFESEIRHLENLHVFFDLRMLEGWALGSQWRRLSFDSKHRTSLAKIAIVGPPRKTRWMERGGRPLSYRKLKKFCTQDIDSAWAWMEESLIEKLQTRMRDLGI